MNPLQNLPGAFIVVEGPDGSGKTTAARLLHRHLVDSGVDAIITRNIGGSQLAERLRAMILDPSTPLDPVEQNLLVTAARRSNLMSVVKHALERGAVVVCDRFVASTMIYQTTSREGGVSISEQDVMALHRIACHDAAPDLTFHVHAPAAVRARRRQIRDEGFDRFDNGDQAFDEEIAAKYARVGEVLGHRTVDIDGSGTPEETLEAMLRECRRLATGRAWSIMVHAPRAPSSTSWRPLLEESGSVYWTEHPHEAHRRAADLIREAGGSLQTRFAPRSLAIDALKRGGVSTSDIESASLT